MKILHVVSSLNVGGAERFVVDLAREQSKNKNVVPCILSMGVEGEPLEQEIGKYGIQLYRATRIGDIKMILNSFNVVNIHSSFCLLRVLLASMLCNISVVYTRHNERVHKSLKWRCTYMLALFKLHNIIFVADKGKSNFLSVYPKFSLKAQVILNGVLPFNQQKTDSETIRVGHVGRFVPLKSQHILIEAIGKLSTKQKQRIKVSFYGDGELLSKHKELAKAIAHDASISFEGVVTNRDDIYANLDLLIVTSETEGLSLAVLEAMASASPIIASNVGGNPELVKHNTNGFLYDYADSETLANCIAKIIDNPELIKEFGEKSKKIYEQKFSMKQCANLYLNSYK